MTSFQSILAANGTTTTKPRNGASNMPTRDPNNYRQYYRSTAETLARRAELKRVIRWIIAYALVGAFAAAVALAAA
jgi:hypothetical protein